MLSDEKKKLLSDLAIGKNVTSSMTMDEQVAAIRKQVDLILVAYPKSEIDLDYKRLSEVVAAEEVKKTKWPHERRLTIRLEGHE
jgi:hypothetical protein